MYYAVYQGCELALHPNRFVMVKHDGRQILICNRTKYTTRPLWRGLSYHCRDLDLGEERFVRISYSPTALPGNGFQAYIEASYLETLLKRFNLDWEVVPNEYHPHDATVRPRMMRPHEIRRRTYLNAHNKTTFGAEVSWQIDEWAKTEDLWLGAHWPSEEEASTAIDRFVAKALAEAPHSIHDTRRLLEVVANNKVLKARFPDFECPPDLQ